MKKLLRIVVACCMMIGMAGQASAYFENDHLVLAIYNQDDNQVGLDLGAVSTLNRAAGSNQVLAGPGSFSLADFGPVVNDPATSNDWANVYAGVFTAYTASAQQNMYFATTRETVPAINYLASVNMGTGSGQVHTLFRADDTSAKFVGPANATTGYDMKMNQGSTNPGGMGGFHNEGLENPVAEPSLADLGTIGYIDLYLYQWDRNAAGNHFLPGVGTDYQGIVRLSSDGSAVFNPVPIPGALILFGSGLMALVGIRRRNA